MHRNNFHTVVKVLKGSYGSYSLNTAALANNLGLSVEVIMSDIQA